MNKLLASFIVLSVSFASAAETVTFKLEPGSGTVGPTFVVDGLPAAVVEGATKWTADDWSKVFVVHTLQHDRISPVPLLGEYASASGKLVFTPRYPLRPGITYRAIWRAPGAKTVEFSRDFALPAPKAAPPTQLTAIYPSREVLPENLLKFYLHFSAPMSRGEVYQRVRLLDQQGKPVEYPFLELAEELWSPDGKRLTLYFDPGRIKRGLKPRELFGPALIEGHSYTLQVAAAWPDAHSQPLAGPTWISKSFRVTAPDDQQPHIKSWKVIPPRAGTRDPLAVTFDEPLDSAMLVRVLSIQDSHGVAIPGEAVIGKEEASWTFRPASAWSTGQYTLVAPTTLEDMAGNSLGRPFEVDVFRPAPKDAETPTEAIRFEIGPSVAAPGR